MAEFTYQLAEDVAKELYTRALKVLPPDVREALQRAERRETQPIAKTNLQTILKSIAVSDGQDMLVCQDTGLPVYMVKIGKRPVVDGARLAEALARGTRRATLEHPFRGSSTHPLTRENPQTSIGEGLPVIHWEFDPRAEHLEILMVPKGSGSENMSAVKMCTPAEGQAAVKRFVIDTVTGAGGNPCPPGIIGVGVGGTFELVAMLAKKAIARPVGRRNADPAFAQLEEDLEEAINSSGSGPMGLGGDVSTLAVHVEWAYTHITQNPVAVNTQCWAARRARARIRDDGQVEYGF